MRADLDNVIFHTNISWDEEKDEIRAHETKHNHGRSEIQKFYKDQTVFITGATGFLGTLLVEKLLRSCPQVRKLIIMVRKKRDQSVEERVKNYFREDIFDKMRLSNRDYHEKVDIVCGQLEADDFGLSPSDAQRLTSQTSIVFHVAATVRFNEHIRSAYNINVKGTKTALSLAKNMPRLKSFVYVSTAYSNCDRPFIREVFYPPTYTEEQLSILMGCASDEEMAILNEVLIEKKPNTYTLTKATAEDLVREAARDLPVCVFRPSIVFPTLQEPLPLWIKGFNGVLALSLAGGLGLIHVALVDPDMSIDLVPADLTINALTTIPWYQSTQCPDKTVFNYVSCNDNRVSYRNLQDEALDKGILEAEESCDSVVWLQFSYLTTKILIFYILFYVFHFFPMILLNFGEKLKHRKPRTLKIFRKYIFLVKTMKHFSLNPWLFESENTRSMVNALSENDRNQFESSMSSFRWQTIFLHLPRLSAIYILHEQPSKELYQSKMPLIIWIHCLISLTIKAIALYLFLNIVANQINYYFT